MLKRPLYLNIDSSGTVMGIIKDINLRFAPISSMKSGFFK